jgi:transcriptional regulator with XRE-family HTH domain
MAGLTQEQLAAKLGITQRVLSHWERAPVALRADQLMALANALHVSADFLLGREPTTPRTSGPAGKARRVFEQVSQLPRHQQQKILEVVEAFVAQQTTR